MTLIWGLKQLWNDTFKSSHRKPNNSFLVFKEFPLSLTLDKISNSTTAMRENGFSCSLRIWWYHPLWVLLQCRTAREGWSLWDRTHWGHWAALLALLALLFFLWWVGVIPAMLSLAGTVPSFWPGLLVLRRAFTDFVCRNSSFPLG